MVGALETVLVHDKVPVDDALCVGVPLIVGVADGVLERDSAKVCCVVETEVGVKVGEEEVMSVSVVVEVDEENE